MFKPQQDLYFFLNLDLMTSYMFTGVWWLRLIKLRDRPDKANNARQ